MVQYPHLQALHFDHISLYFAQYASKGVFTELYLRILIFNTLHI